MWKQVFLLFLAVHVVLPSCSSCSCSSQPSNGCKGPNEEPGCSLNCNQQCQNYIENQTGPCPRIACPPGCKCKKNFYYDTNKKKCVAPKYCTLPKK